MAFSYQQHEPSSRRFMGIGVAAVAHLIIGWALVSGLAGKVVEAIKKPLEARIIQEVHLPPPPPPPKQIKSPPPAPKVVAPPPLPFVPPPEIAPQAASPSAITMVASTPPPVEYKIEAPPPAPATPAAPRRQDIGVVCPTQVRPEIPAEALDRGISGKVTAQVRISDGVVKEVAILSGPRVYHAAVRAALQRYKCASGDGDVLAVQEFNFKVE
jgi:protein TonB